MVPHLTKMPPGNLLGEVFWVCLNGRGPQGRPRTQNRDYVSLLAWECPSEELEEVPQGEEGVASGGASVLTHTAEMCLR